MQNAERNRITASRRELVDIEWKRLTSLRRGREVLEQRRLVEREVRRPDHRDRVGAEVGGVRRELFGLARRLRPAMHGDREPVRARRDEQFSSAPTLRVAEQDPFTGGAEREQPVEPAALEERDERVERVLVEGFPAPRQRGHCGCEGTFEHRNDSKASLAMPSKRPSDSPGRPLNRAGERTCFGNSETVRP